MIATINIKDKSFKTNIDTLLKIPFFNKQIEKDINMNIFELDMDAEIFSNILNNVRFGTEYSNEHVNELIILGLINDNENNIRLNIGGTYIYCNKEVLNKYEYFNNILSNKWFKENEIFIDMDIDAFRHIYKYMLNNTYKIPSKYSPEVDFFSIKKKSDLSDVSMLDNFDDIETTLLKSKINLESLSYMHTYYVKNPLVTFHRKQYKRCTNYYPCYSTIPLNINNFNEVITIKIPSSIKYPSYYILDLTFDIINNLPFLDSTHIIKWIDHIETHFFEYIDVYHGANFITRINSESLYINHLENGFKYNNNNLNKLLIPITSYFSDENVVIPNGSKDREITFKIKPRPFKQLLKIINTENIDITNLFDNVNDIFNVNIINSSLNIKHHLLDTEEDNRFTHCNFDYYLYNYLSDKLTINADYNENLIIPLTHNIMINKIAIFIKDKNLLEPIPFDDCNIYNLFDCIELWNDDKCYIKLNGFHAYKIYETERYKYSKDTDYYSRIDATGYGLDSLNVLNYSMKDNIIIINYSLPHTRSIAIDMFCTNSTYVKVKLNKNNCYDLTNKEIVVAYYGDKIIRFMDSNGEKIVSIIGGLTTAY
jgi:hypothetical protein